MAPLLQLLAGDCYSAPPPLPVGGRSHLPAPPADVPTECSDINRLFSSVNDTNTQCCPGSSCSAGPPTTCSLRCGAAAVTLIDGCGAVLSQLLPQSFGSSVFALFREHFVIFVGVS